MPSITRRGDNFLLRYYELDGRQRSRSYTSRAAVLADIAEIETAHDRRSEWIPPEDRPVPDYGEIGEVIRAYLTAQVLTFADSTMIRYGEALELLLRFLEVLKPGWRWTLLDFKRDLFAQGWTWLATPATARHGRRRSDVTIAKIIEVWELMWIWAADSDQWGDLTPRPRRLEKPDRPTPEPNAPTWSEWDQMMVALATAQKAAWWSVQLALLARFLGERRTALLLLTGDAFDLARGRVRIPGHITKGGYGGREVPIHPWLADELRTWNLQRDIPVIDAPTLELTGRGHADRNLRRAWLRAGIDEEVWAGQPIHAARMMIETQLGLSNTPQAIIDAYLGHQSQGTGGRHYRDRRRQVWGPMVAAVATIPAPQDQDVIMALKAKSKHQLERRDISKMAAGHGNRYQARVWPW